MQYLNWYTPWYTINWFTFEIVLYTPFVLSTWPAALNGMCRTVSTFALQFVWMYMSSVTSVTKLTWITYYLMDCLVRACYDKKVIGKKERHLGTMGQCFQSFVCEIRLYLFVSCDYLYSFIKTECLCVYSCLVVHVHHNN